MNEEPKPIVLELDRTFAAPPERVYRAWTEPSEMVRWFCPSPEVPTTVDADVRVGGAYRIAMGSNVVSGAYRTVDPPHALAFTWGWANDDEPARMLVTVTLERIDGGGTRLRLRHERFANDEERANHEWGWTASLARLPGALEGMADDGA